MGKVLCELIKQKNKSGENKIITCGVALKARENKLFPVLENINKFNNQADVLIDFSCYKAVPEIIKFCVNKKIPAVICTTGLNLEINNLIQEASKNIAIVKSANMSLGINIINLVIQDIANLLFKLNFDIEILEKHHNKKLDAPSGTAIMLAELIKQEIKNKSNQDLEINLEKNKLREKNSIGIASIRCGNITGEHSIYFSGSSETIEIKHTASSREIFAHGALRAAEFIIKQDTGLYSMHDVLQDLIKSSF